MSGPSSSIVAIVIPMSLRPELLPDEALSLRHVCHHLHAYDKYLVAPSGAIVGRDGFATLHFPRKFFGSLAAHNNLLMWPPFYRAFRRYQYILIYHLDSLVFSDALMRWCQTGVDFIGPPWIPGPDAPWVKEARVGNGGFTLMKVDTVLQVLRNRYRQEPRAYLADLVTRNAAWFRPVYALLERAQRVFPHSRLVGHVLAHRDAGQHPARHGNNNDAFWSLRAVNYLPGFRVATVEEGLQFAFESSPRRCFELNGGRLPFGCHAWTKFDRAFWEPYLLRGDAPNP